MICTPVRNGSGRVVAIACGTRKREGSKCAQCHRPATHLCDAELSAPRVVNGWTFPNPTCDAMLCEQCRIVSGGKDYCRACARISKP